jgi:ElaB/YqjD/DUF883 family membrane-anchored ribosome-binding protein
MAIEAEGGGQPEDLHDQIARLRARLDALLKEKVTPAVAAVAGRAEEAAHTARQQAEMLAGHVRERPLTALLVAATVGWVIGCAMR